MESLNPLLKPKLREKHILGGASKALIVFGAPGDKDKAVKSFHAWVQGLDPLDMIMYTDRSQETDQTGTLTGVKTSWVINTG